ncbi:MAG: D-aminoacyl-tRNA deacylase, partial [Candidatus Diapherotrites archaeon]|nr:D-aminoacyl-tRNA deacylase [Candidatus Diapherotrites archaeon]
MKFSIIVSKTDIAGMNAKQILVEEKGFKETSREFDGNKVFEFHNSLGEFELITLEEVQIFADKVNDLETDFLVFASKHANKSGQAEFTVHALANWGKAEYGGKDKNVCKSSGVLMRNYFEGLEKFRKEF